MANMVDRGRAMLARQMQTAAGVAILVERLTDDVQYQFTATAWVGNTLFRLQTGDGGSRVEWGERDYLIPAAAYDFGTGPVEPREHDRITETINGVANVFDVLPPEGEPAWRWSDPGRTILRVHTKRVG